MKLIDEDKLVAKINELKEHFVNERDDFEKGYHSSLNAVSDYLSTLEMKEIEGEELDKLLDWWKERTTEHSCQHVKEVDLEKEISEYFVEHSDEFFSDKYKLFAKHFFELGLKARKGE